MPSAIAQCIRSIQSFDSRFDDGLVLAGDIDTSFVNFTQAENNGK
jgi:cytochrome c peroxidase